MQGLPSVQNASVSQILTQAAPIESPSWVRRNAPLFARPWNWASVSILWKAMRRYLNWANFRACSCDRTKVPQVGPTTTQKTPEAQDSDLPRPLSSPPNGHAWPAAMGQSAWPHESTRYAQDGAERVGHPARLEAASIQ
jgi:hypothetical protein